MRQSTSTVLMIRPVAFGFNTQTSASNVFQIPSTEKNQILQTKALQEFDEMVKQIKLLKINVLLFSDTENPHTPDSIFPNNWISFHENKTMVLYPMEAKNRRLERRNDILEVLKNQYKFQKWEDLTAYENEGIYLEGTGSIVLDRENKMAYACLSSRTQVRVLQEFKQRMNYRSIVFQAVTEDKTPIYHTNVVMSIGSEFAVVCLDSIQNIHEKKPLIKSLTAAKKEIIDISYSQLHSFAGNILEVQSKKGEKYILMSETAKCSFSASQKNTLEKYAKIQSFSIPTIENIGGGSVRCMLAEVF